MNKTEIEKWKELLPVSRFPMRAEYVEGSKICNPFKNIQCTTATCTHSVDKKCSLDFIPIDNDFKCKNDKMEQIKRVKCADCFRMRPNKCGEKFCTGWNEKPPFFIDNIKLKHKCGHFIGRI